jgi:hypothetical protein
MKKILMTVLMVVALFISAPAFSYETPGVESYMWTEVIATVSPTSIYEATQPLTNPSTVIPNAIPQLQFGTVKAVDVPIVDARVRPLQKDDILLEVLLTKTTKINGLFETLIKMNRTINSKGYNMANVRVIVFEKLSTKMWSTGGNISASGAGYVGTGSMGGAGGLMPSYGRMTADSVFIAQYILVVSK